MYEFTTIEGLKEGFEANNDKCRSMHNLCQKLVVLEGSFDSRTVVATLVPKRYMKLVHTTKELILTGNEERFLAQKFKVNE